MRIEQEEKDETHTGERLYNGIVLPEKWHFAHG